MCPEMLYFRVMAFTTLKFTGTIPHVLEDTPLINRQHIHFLHDGASAHFSRTARRYLDRKFPDRWIGRGGPIAWPPRSPDLNPLDFYLWGHLKSLVYSSPVPDLESLRNRIVACSEDIRNTPGVWDRVHREHGCIEGRTLSTTRCRHPDCSELETLGHVLGQCPKGELLINARHHRVRHALAISLKTLNWEIHEEIHCVSSDGSFRWADIIAINGRLKRALVLDHTIRFEINLNQATEVDIEKKSIYEPCLPYLSQKYNVPLKQWSVIGLLFGSRGSVTKFTWNYLKELHIPFDYKEHLLRTFGKRTKKETSEVLWLECDIMEQKHGYYHKVKRSE
ncbi:hypothetical protein ANN_12469 [Periplaneta americana]|uniref:Uncharacterized protein n=1 Tax=Periplaneta americana TaxID=6978 RepID=A0ABQ8TH79_PERAM|nr:hypothetical protein ANN_12469 [Periplaneta americana]